LSKIPKSEVDLSTLENKFKELSDKLSKIPTKEIDLSIFNEKFKEITEKLSEIPTKEVDLSTLDEKITDILEKLSKNNTPEVDLSELDTKFKEISILNSKIDNVLDEIKNTQLETYTKQISTDVHILHEKIEKIPDVTSTLSMIDGNMSKLSDKVSSLV